jgi:DNA-binding transcriptional ArsR family regulator
MRAIACRGHRATRRRQVIACHSPCRLRKGLAWVTGRAQNPVPHHLPTLRAAGFVSSKSQGKMVLYSLTPSREKLVRAVLAGVSALQGAKVCTYLSAILLFGPVTNALFGWWWPTPSPAWASPRSRPGRTRAVDYEGLMLSVRRLDVAQAEQVHKTDACAEGVFADNCRQD